MHGFQTSLNRKKLNKNGEEGYKIQLARCLFFKNTDVKAKREETLTYKVTQQRRHRGKTQKKQFWRVFEPKRGGSLLPKARSIIALCARLRGSVGALLTLGQGRQGLKFLEMSKNQKIAIQFRQLC
jgi:hypothetical protein